MQYKGYVGSVEFSEADGLFFGKVLGIRALISYEGTNAAELVADFHGAVDDYLKERGIKKKDFLVDIITRALEEAEAAEPVTEASPQDELEEQPEADET